MSELAQTTSEARPPRASEVLALLIIVPAVGAAARALATGSLTTPRQSALVVGVAAGLVGLPALAWLFERGRLSVTALASAGAVAGVVPPILLAMSGAVGLLFLGGFEYAWWALGKGASLPLYGTLGWGKYFQLLAWSISVGVASGVIYALVVPSEGWRRPWSWGIAVLTILVMLVVGKLFG
jgi:hypothetical protein